MGHLTKNQQKTDNDSTFIDRRLFTRFPIKLLLGFLKTGREKLYEGKTTDISANGIAFTSETKLPSKTALEIWLDMPIPFKPLYITGKVIWSKVLKKNQKIWQIGVHFDKTNLIGLGKIFNKSLPE